MFQDIEDVPSGYYAWLKRPVSKRKQENERLVKEIRSAHEMSRKTYGSPRITVELNENGIAAKTKRKFKITTNSESRRESSAF